MGTLYQVAFLVTVVVTIILLVAAYKLTLNFMYGPPGFFLHLTKASLRCCISLWKTSGSVQAVLVLCVRVPMTLYLAERL